MVPITSHDYHTLVTESEASIHAHWVMKISFTDAIVFGVNVGDLKYVTSYVIIHRSAQETYLQYHGFDAPGTAKYRVLEAGLRAGRGGTINLVAFEISYVEKRTHQA